MLKKLHHSKRNLQHSPCSVPKVTKKKKKGYYYVVGHDTSKYNSSIHQNVAFT